MVRLQERVFGAIFRGKSRGGEFLTKALAAEQVWIEFAMRSQPHATTWPAQLDQQGQADFTVGYMYTMAYERAVPKERKKEGFDSIAQLLFHTALDEAGLSHKCNQRLLVSEVWYDFDFVFPDRGLVIQLQGLAEEDHIKNALKMSYLNSRGWEVRCFPLYIATETQLRDRILSELRSSFQFPIRPFDSLEFSNESSQMGKGDEDESI
jgi:hypothetical protein